mmetsp:Transcript_10507/g.14837  ORF Transcript_10507/g.14837 Transcript_10507/m.14837 type:complete len:154 (+) Transcript_10507:144-605(+)|eukprot:CAMPEP_0184858452 /NCGR_PEP_ID=MMETSP0580-20130426/3552_1 /TAXON_ID=1118495 /ORGANISM="Dactyliosolen fragilissimus" /LENGTH=153 /DNA_ID=CAMNT_0027354599 /DNA_START=72 /DNA_END=533 /DNA_ORIENTATION=+
MTLDHDMKTNSNNQSSSNPNSSSFNDRRGSSLFAATDQSATGPYGRPAYLQGDVYAEQGSALLVDFPDSDDDDVPMNTGDNHKSENPKARVSESARMAQLANSEDLPGGRNHRPLVGGFAAAAYEAARAHHYSSNAKEANANIPRDRPPPPSI